MNEEHSPLQLDSFQKSYCMISSLGYGSFGHAVLAKYKKSTLALFAPRKYKRGTLLEPGVKTMPYTDGVVAVKVMKSVLKVPADYLRVNEVRFILSVLSHPNLLQIFDLFIDTDSGKLNIVMEPMSQNLYQFIQKHESRPLASWVTKSMLSQLLNAIRHIHSHGYFHRDVKPENILITSTKLYFGGAQNIPPERAKDLYMLKLCDYGLARHVSNTRAYTQYVSTRWYRSPEILLRQGVYDLPVDIWAFGVVAVELVNFHPMFAGQNETDQLWQLLTKLGHPLYQNRALDELGGSWPEGVQLADKLGFVLPHMAGQTVHDIFYTSGHDQLARTIQRCFMWDPRQRPTASTLCHADYFKGTVVEEDPLHYLTCDDEVLNNENCLKNLILDELNYVPTTTSLKPSLIMHSDPVTEYRPFSVSSCDADVSGELDEQFFLAAAPKLKPERPLRHTRSKFIIEGAALQAKNSFGSQEVLC